MKKILMTLVAIIFTATIFTSCEPVETRKDCEINSYGEMTIRNSTGFRGYVDCTYTRNGVNYEAYVNSGSSHKYQMDAGSVYVWFSFNGNDWVYDTEYLSSCENTTYTWYYDKKKSTDGGLNLEIKNEEGEVIKTITEFEIGQR